MAKPIIDTSGPPHERVLCSRTLARATEAVQADLETSYNRKYIRRERVLHLASLDRHTTMAYGRHTVQTHACWILACTCVVNEVSALIHQQPCV